MMLGQLDADKAAAAREPLEQASRGFAAAETGEADADAMLVLCAQILGDTAARDQALEHVVRCASP